MILFFQMMCKILFVILWLVLLDLRLHIDVLEAQYIQGDDFYSKRSYSIFVNISFPFYFDYTQLIKQQIHEIQIDLMHAFENVCKYIIHLKQIRSISYVRLNDLWTLPACVRVKLVGVSTQVIRVLKKKQGITIIYCYQYGKSLEILLSRMLRDFSRKVS